MNPVVSIAIVAVGVVVSFIAIATPRRWLAIVPAAVVAGALAAAAFRVTLTGGEPAVGVGIAIGLGVIGIVAGSPVVGLALRFAQAGVRLGVHGGIVVDRPDGDDDHEPDTGWFGRKRRRPEPPVQAVEPAREILKGGATIGYLERAGLIGAVALGQVAAVAVIVAVKGLGRFSELDGSEARERFIIGTLTSLIWAGACAAAAVLTV